MIDGNVGVEVHGDQFGGGGFRFLAGRAEEPVAEPAVFFVG